MPPLTEAEKKIFFSTAEDAEPEVRGGISKGMENLHYTIGNEWTLFAFYKDIKNLGGGYMGVGTDQAYLFIGWQKPELAWLTDYDPKIQRMHHMYKALFLAAESPKEFTSYFQKENMDKALAAIASSYEGKDRAKAQATYKRARKLINFRMFKMKKRFKGSKGPHVLQRPGAVRLRQEDVRARPHSPDAREPARVRGRQGRQRCRRRARRPHPRAVHLQCGGVLEDLRGAIPDEHRLAAQRRHVPPVAHAPDLEHHNDYVYIVQPIDNYRAWLADPEVTSVRQMLGGRPKASADKVNYFRVKRLPASARNKDVSAP